MLSMTQNPAFYVGDMGDSNERHAGCPAAVLESAATRESMFIV